MAINFNKPVYCIISGASRGIGRTIAIETARRCLDKLILILFARSESGLNETKNLVLNIKNDAKVINFVTDLSIPNVQDYENILNSTLCGLQKGDLDSAVIFHNAGQIGDLKLVIDLSEVSIWQNYFNLNMFSVTALNSVFVKVVRKVTNNIAVINITSLFGRKPGKYVGLYGTAKAARDMYFKILAEEESYIKVLNWSPGMVRTDMAMSLLEQLDIIEGTNLKSDKIMNVLTPEQTINKMFSVLEENKFKTGDIVDYYDV